MLRFINQPEVQVGGEAPRERVERAGLLGNALVFLFERFGAVGGASSGGTGARRDGPSMRMVMQ